MSRRSARMSSRVRGPRWAWGAGCNSGAFAEENQMFP
jgi:hypothetical protein